MTYSFDIKHSPELGGEPILDAETFGVLEELAGDDDPDLIAELIGLFLEDSMERMGQIKAAAESQDATTIGSAAHALKSSSANIGARSFSRVCSEMETASRSEGGIDPAQYEALLRRAMAMYAEVCRVLDPAQVGS